MSSLIFLCILKQSNFLSNSSISEQRSPYHFSFACLIFFGIESCIESYFSLFNLFSRLKSIKSNISSVIHSAFLDRGVDTKILSLASIIIDVLKFYHACFVCEKTGLSFSCFSLHILSLMPRRSCVLDSGFFSLSRSTLVVFVGCWIFFSRTLRL